MGVYFIPVEYDEPHFEIRVELEARTYAMEVRWNSRAGAYFLTLKSGDGEPIVSSRKMVLGVLLNRLAVGDRAPPGLLTLFDTTRRDEEAGLGELGRRVQLVYVDSTETP